MDIDEAILEEKLLKGQEMTRSRYIKLVFSKSLSIFSFIFTLDILIYFGVLSFTPYSLDPFWILFTSSGFVFMMAGLIGNFGTSHSLQGFSRMITEWFGIDYNPRKKAEYDMVASILVYILVGIYLFTLSFVLPVLLLSII